jgi:hypothetical protein
LVNLRQNSNSLALLKNLSPKEASLVDNASGMYLRFRLGGTKFPPLIYYKIYTARNVMDLGAFAPRDYEKERVSMAVTTTHVHGSSEAKHRITEEHKQYWYRRQENNGWRAIADDSLMDAENEEMYIESAKKPEIYHHSKLVRQVDLVRKRKRKKLAWIKKMYKLGREQEEQGGNNTSTTTTTTTTTTGQHDPYTEIAEQLMQLDENSNDVFEVDWEDEADDLLQWTSDLDFENYQDAWLTAATTKPVDVYLRDQEASIALEMQQQTTTNILDHEDTTVEPPLPQQQQPRYRI